MASTTPPPNSDRYLAAAIRLGRHNLGRSWPNPSVGCLVVQNGRIVGRGVTGAGGRPHAETIALDQAGDAARGASVYVSLEPCNHHGKTAPCTEALMASAVSRVVIAHGDPDPRVSGGGAARLSNAGIEVEFEPSNRLKNAAALAHRGHFMRMVKGRPYVTLKLALSRDGAIGLPGQGQIAITNAQTNQLMHGLRTRFDAIAVGAGTWRVDQPQLTVRLPGLRERSPQRVVFGQVDAPSDVLQCADHDLGQALRDLAAQGLTHLLVEGGATLAQAFLEAELVDAMILIEGSVTLGPAGLRPFQAHPFDDLRAAGLGDWVITHRRSVGEDRMMTLGRAVERGPISKEGA